MPGFGTSSSPPESCWTSPFTSPAPAFGDSSSSPFGASKSSTSGFVTFASAASGASSSLFGTSKSSTSGFVTSGSAASGASSSLFGTCKSSTSGFVTPAAFGNAASGASSSLFGTSKFFTPGSVTPATSGNASSAFGASVAPSSGTAFSASSTPLGTSVWSRSGFVPPATSFGNASSAFGASFAPSSSSAFGASSLPRGTSTWSTPGFVPAAAFGNMSSTFVASVAPSSGTVVASSSPFGTSLWSTQGFVPPATSFGSSAFGASLAPNSSKPGLGTEASSFGVSTYSFGASATTPSSDGGLGDVSILRGSTGVSGTQQNHWSFPAATSNTSSHPHLPAFSNSLPPQPSMGTVSNEWSSAPWMKCHDERGSFFQPSVAMANIFPSVPDHRIPSTSNLFVSQTKRVDNTYSGGSSSTKTDFPKTPFPLVRPYEGMLFQNNGSRLTAYTETLDQEGKFQSISAMPKYRNKSHEELKLEDYRLRDKGGCKEFLTAPPTPFSFMSSGPFSPKPFPFVSCTSSPGVSSGATSFLTSTNSQPLQLSQLLAPLGRLTSPYIGSETTTITVPQNIPSSATSTTVPQTMTPLEQQSVIANPSEALNMAQTSVHHPDTLFSIQFGISSRPVTDHPSPARPTSLLRLKHLSIRANRLQSKKGNSKSDAPKLSFLTEEAKNCGTLKADSSIISRNNPGCWISSPSKEPKRTNTSSEDRMSGSAKDLRNLAGHNENLEMLLPKLVAADYYTEPSISELAAQEKAEPGFCSRVKDFVVGRVGYGSIKFLLETDVRKLELDSIIKFNHGELCVYFNESMEKPPVGQGLNKPAEATLLEVKCIGTKSGNQYIDGPKVDKCRERLIKKAAEHGAEFISYNPVVGEWKFRVQHF